MASRKTWSLGAAAVLLLAMIGSCNDDDSSSTTKNATPTTTTAIAALAPKDRDVWVGTVAAHPTNYGFPPEIGIDLGNGYIESVAFAHLGEPVCGNYSAGDFRRTSIRSRIQQLLPVGTTVRVVRGRELLGSKPRFTDEGFVFVEGTATSVGSDPSSVPPTTSPTATTTAPTSTVGKTTTTASETTSPEPSAPTTTAAVEEELLVNEVLLREGFAVPDDPDIDLSVMASKTVEEQLHGPWALEVEPNISYFDRLLSAHRVAWDGSIGFIADCRAKEARDVLEKQQRDELDRIRRGPDGELGTSDDDTRLWRYDEDGNLSVYTPSVSSGSGGSGGGGGGGICRRSRWC